MKIQVTEDHIRKGRRGDCFTCPISLAVLENYPDQEFGYVQTGSGLVDIDKERFVLPEQAVEFVRHFDAGKPVTPFEFEIEQQGAKNDQR